jgi:hypothetical protein
VADPDHLGDQLSAFGIDPEAVEAARDREAEAMQFGVHADNWTLLGVFLALQTQWRVAVGMTGVHYLGIDYGALPPVLSLLGIPKPKHAEAFAAVRLMESAALRIRNAPAEATDGR